MDETGISESRQKFDDMPLRKTMVRPTLDFLRGNMFSFDIPDTARYAGLPEQVVYRALLKQPIERIEAEKLLEELSVQHKIDPPLTINDVDIPTYEEQLVLHLAHASGNEDAGDDFALVYAESEDHAEELLRHWLKPLSASHPTINIYRLQHGIPIYGGERIQGHKQKAHESR